jgi:dephospho-CoA kinase
VKEYKIKVAISAIGKISSGKSSFAKYVSQKHGIPIASFGAYVKYYCEQHHLPLDRDNLQNVGLNLVKTNYIDFLNRVIQHYGNGSPYLIFDGIRNLTIFQAVKEISEHSVSIFIDTPSIIRFERYNLRKKNSDQMVTLDEFNKIDNHKIEMEIESLQSYCDYVIDGTKEYLNTVDEEINRLVAPNKV